MKIEKNKYLFQKINKNLAETTTKFYYIIIKFICKKAI